MSLSDAAREAIYLKRFFNEILGVNVAISICNDNQGALKLSKNPVFHNCTKHIDMRHHFVREAAERRDVILQYLPTHGEAKSKISIHKSKIFFYYFFMFDPPYGYCINPQSHC